MKQLDFAALDPEEDPLTLVLPIGYDGEIVDDFFNVMLTLRDGESRWWTDIASNLGFSPKYAHLILEVLADRGITDYGTSPRGSWLTDDGRKLLDAAEAYRKEGAK